MQPVNLWNINYFFDKAFTMDIKRLNDATPEEWTKAGIRAVLNQREKNYGDYSDVSDTSQRIKNVLRQNPNWDELYQFQRESLDMIANKIARIVNGNNDYADSWVDICGYSQLVVDRLKDND
jgi:nucleoid-associated protein YejK